MIIVAGALHVDPQERQEYLDSCVEVIVAARGAPGCIDFHLSPDPLEPGRINVFEQWESAEAVEQFRGAGPSSEQVATILGASVFQHEIERSAQL